MRATGRRGNDALELPDFCTCRLVCLVVSCTEGSCTGARRAPYSGAIVQQAPEQYDIALSSKGGANDGRLGSVKGQG